MALSAGPDSTGPIPEYSTYHYNYHTLHAAANDIE